MSTKIVRTPGYNYDFNDVTGEFSRWGLEKKDDPQFSPIGEEIVDIELSTICSGIRGIPCKHCYKSNTLVGKNMDLETFKRIFLKLPKNTTQFAAGIGDLNANPDLLDIFWYSRDNGAVPNVTINGWGLTPEWAFKLAEVCGAVAVSRYDDKNICYDAVEKLVAAGLKQVNIHQLVAEETYENCLETVRDIEIDPRLKDLNAIVFLSLKKKGRGEGYTRMSQEGFDTIVSYCLDNWIRFGFDSCSSSRFINYLNDHPKYDIMKDQMKQSIEPCESTLFSLYINVDGEAFPCSFCEGTVCGQDVLSCGDFLSDIWYGELFKSFRNTLIKGCRNCPIYEV
jgi:MoaA/NifB/PqqE/SkfB family radical SAM enzyme